MEIWLDMYVAMRDFFERGGWVLYGILIATTLMWTLIIERLWYFYGVLPRRVRDIEGSWQQRGDKSSWYARRIRDMWISQVSVATKRHLMLIKTIMAILPLLGLLGTVTGMVSVFEVMAVYGTGNARLMAGGVSRATLPTMSGLVAALSGLYLASFLEHRANAEIERTEDLLIRG